MRNKKVSIRGGLMRDMIHDIMETSLGKPIQTGEFRKNPVEPAWVCPSGYEYEIIENGPFKMEFLKPEGVVTGRAVLQLHGGGYIGPMKNIYRKFAVRYSKLSFGGDVLTIDYRVAPEYQYPAALEDAVYAYKWLIQEKEYEPDHIIVAGDSAGGGLALALVLYLRDNRLPLPGGIITMSPWADMTNSGASYTDNMLFHSSYIGDADPKNPYLSPLFGDFQGFPPVLMQVGSYEVLLSDTLGVADKLKQAGVRRRLSVYEGMFHVFQMGLDLIPESREAWNEVEEFLRITYGISRKPDGKVVKRVKTQRKKSAAQVAGRVLEAMKKNLPDSRAVKQ